MNETKTKAPDDQAGIAPSVKRSIFDIDAELDGIAMAFDQLAETGEEGAVLEAIEKYFGGLLDDRDRKIDGYCALISQYTAMASVRRAEANRLLELSKTDDNAAKRLKDRLKYFLDSKEITKIETPLHKLSVVGNGGLQALTIHPDVIENPAAILPAEFQKITVQPNTEAIRAELAKPEDEQLPLIKQLAKLEPRGTSLRIK